MLHTKFEFVLIDSEGVDSPAHFQHPIRGCIWFWSDESSSDRTPGVPVEAQSLHSDKLIKGGGAAWGNHRFPFAGKKKYIAIILLVLEILIFKK